MIFRSMYTQHYNALMIIIIQATTGYFYAHATCPHFLYSSCHRAACPARSDKKAINNENANIAEGFIIQPFAYRNHTSNVLRVCNCGLDGVSADAFFGLANLPFLDISRNRLKKLPAGTLQPLKRLEMLTLASM